MQRVGHDEPDAWSVDAGGTDLMSSLPKKCLMSPSLRPCVPARSGRTGGGQEMRQLRLDLHGAGVHGEYHVVQLDVVGVRWRVSLDLYHSPQSLEVLLQDQTEPVVWNFDV